MRVIEKCLNVMEDVVPITTETTESLGLVAQIRTIDKKRLEALAGTSRESLR